MTVEGHVQNVSSLGEGESGKRGICGNHGDEGAGPTSDKCHLVSDRYAIVNTRGVLTIRRLRASTGMSSGLIPTMHLCGVFFPLLSCAACSVCGPGPQPGLRVLTVPVNPTRLWVWSNKGVCTTLLVSKEVCYCS